VCSVRRVPCARGRLVQFSPNAFGLLFLQDTSIVFPLCKKIYRTCDYKLLSRNASLVSAFVLPHPACNCKN